MALEIEIDHLAQWIDTLLADFLVLSQGGRTNLLRYPRKVQKRASVKNARHIYQRTYWPDTVHDSCWARAATLDDPAKTRKYIGHLPLRTFYLPTVF